MTAREVVGSVEFPAGSGLPCVGARVTAALYTGTDGNLAYGTVNDVSLGSTSDLTDNDGAWSLSLEPAANITPAGTVWQITIVTPGRIETTFHVDVPDSAGPHNATDILAEQPGALPSQALAAHAALTAAHGTSGTVVGTNDTQTLTNKTIVSPTIPGGLAVTDGGTGASTAAAARANLGLGATGNADPAAPEWAGALGDGVTDDTTAVQDTLDAYGRLFLRRDARYYLPSGIQLSSNDVIVGNGATIVGPSGSAGSKGIYGPGSNVEHTAVSDLIIKGYETGIDTNKVFYGAWHNVRPYLCGTAILLRGASCYNTFTACHPRSNSIGVKTAVNGSDQPNTNFFIGCKLHGLVTCLDLGLTTNLNFQACSIESGEATALVAMASTARAAFFGCRFEGKVGATITLDSSCADNGFYQSTINASVVITDNGLRTNWIGGKAAAWDNVIGYNLLPGGTSSAVGHEGDTSTLWRSVAAKQLILAEQYAALKMAVALDDANYSFVLHNTGRMEWGTPGAVSDLALYRYTAGVLQTSGQMVATSFKLGTVTIRKGAGSPEGVVTGIVGDLYLRTDGSTSTTLYVKESGTGNTGWTAK